MPKLNGNLWKEFRHKRVITFIPEWQDCPMNKYYKINQILLLCIGLWPYQKSSFRRNIIITFTTIMLILGIVCQLMTFITTEYNIDIFLHVLTYTVPLFAYTLKYNTLCLNIKQIRNLMDRVRYDWNELNNIQEIEIIKEYSAMGRFITITTSLFIYVCIFCFFLIQFFSNFLLDIILSKNESRPRKFPILFECFIDQQKYYFPILLQMCVIIVTGLTTVVATETLNMSYAYHASSLFEVASYRIEQALHKNKVQDTSSSTENNSIIYQGIVNGFIMYGRAIKFIEIWRLHCKWAYSLLLPFGVLSLSINLYRFSRLISSKEYYEMIVSFIFILGHFWYMLFCNYMGQRVIDYSSNIFHKIYNVQWYVAPLRAQKLLLLVMLRSMRHSTLVIGGLFIASLEGFATLASTSISYFAVIFSLF